MKCKSSNGFLCSVSSCKEKSETSQYLSFFRFPSQPIRAKAWAQACGKKKDMSPTKLYSTHRVCSKHFAPHMFLNNLRNRLQPHAIPVLNIEENDTTPTEINVQASPDHCGQDTKPDMCNLVPTCSITNLTGINERTENDSHVSKHDKSVQVQLEIADCCSSKITALKKKCDAAVKRAKRAKIRSKKEKTQKYMTLDELHDLMSQFYPKTMIDFLRNQAANLKKEEW
ncbi:uncharacterized protein LOC128888306 [Hylaeus anthracinus]|uniref:uncharacterized protein LOC128888306 n=1 Tax=Hylaeus anthracinus TaxID=313031 RepID=UPI0023B929E0|nr:uncharacterized protein LOC128888306 [Hylaeus anthracinus]XP_054001020.1 uncharacterized protein LOC128888306 [Hylaeus anthracinus]